MLLLFNKPKLEHERGYQIFPVTNWKNKKKEDLDYFVASLLSRTNRQTAPRFPLKAQTINSQRESLRVKGLGSNKSKKSEKIRLVFGPPPSTIYSAPTKM